MSNKTDSASDARERALRILTDIYDGEESGQALLDSATQSDADAGLTAELVLGISRHRITCEHIAAHFYRGRWESLRPSIRTVYSLGIYQLCWLERIPDHAAVDQCVRLARRFGVGIAQSVNAILRKVAAVRGPVVEQSAGVDPRTFLRIDDARGRVFAENIFPDPARRPLDYLVAATSHPPYLVERWHRRFKPALCKQVCEAGARRPSLVLRPNVHRTNTDEFLRTLALQGVSAERITGTDAIVVRDQVRLLELTAFNDGLCQPQDSTSQAAVRLNVPQPGQFVIDLCAGVGTKSTQAAELMNNQGLVLSCDIDVAKLESIPNSASRLGISIIETVPLQQLDSRIESIGRRPDLILVDAPCSNTGVLARRPEARYRASHKNLLSLVHLQQEILPRAAGLAGPHTRIIYSTCSIEEEENEQQANWFAKTFPAFRVAKSYSVLPDRERDGGFAALFVQ